MPLTVIPPRDIAPDLVADANLSLAYWSPPVAPVPRSRRLTAIEAMYAYFGSDRD